MRTKLALSITALYLCGFSLVAGFRGCELVSLPLNELGDFLAGAFGPLALAWLVFGYLQQGDELRQGTKALLLQAEELKASVHQQNEMVEVTKQSLRNNEKVLEPILHLTFESAVSLPNGNGFIMRDSFSIANSGAYCENLVVRVRLNKNVLTAVGVEGLGVGKVFGFNLDDILSEEIYYDFIVSYLKANGVAGEQRFEVCKGWRTGDFKLVVAKQYA
ncbi:hypothetical protein [Pseudomonas farsensis]|uniref:Uncharacterized protein n=1 Tax=Pseudomonas farsensis TaxID=2745492 RepID=A0ABU8QS96_9PSED